jgi:phage host-nuclease inhibitor protein Gam
MTEEKVQETMSLNEKEKKELNFYKDAITQELASLGGLRRQVLDLEKKSVEKLAKMDEEYMMHLKFIFNNKSTDNIDNWVFDPTNLAFVRKPK